ncbi:MAG: hypothetical protein C0508_24150 [Cyanobacteria bacterium PR.023]|nr:hypothetical protein [Cyanobacteria bacterium PR.023]MDO9621339.1 hypothetical protein [Moraxellaceae bacterium]MDZ4297624.1 hypothetical protein [Moraxellaceae bacterium]MDZ4385592.1 hypothetical protein [Moraxellaceae bacterium]
MTSNFTIDQVSWHTKVVGNPESTEQILRRFWLVVDFLQRNGLTKKTLASSPERITDDFAINSNDLTPTGLDLMKKAYDRWLTKVDEGMSPDDLSILEKALAKM